MNGTTIEVRRDTVLTEEGATDVVVVTAPLEQEHNGGAVVLLLPGPIALDLARALLALAPPVDDFPSTVVSHTLTTMLGEEAMHAVRWAVLNYGLGALDL